MRIFVTGLHSDPNPSPGLGEALSLREAFPAAEIIGIDYSTASSGLHHPVFSELQIQEGWDRLDLEKYAAWIQTSLAQPGSIWLSGLDVEIAWLSRALSGCSQILNPLDAVRRACTKPVFSLLPALGMKAPKWIWADSDPVRLQEFGLEANWRVWAKGRYSEAWPAASLDELQQRLHQLQQAWPLTRSFVQEHVDGREFALVFAALQGQLLDAVEIEKRRLTAERKTWAARVQSLSDQDRNSLAGFIKASNWTGGGEIEFIRCGRDRFVIDINPRFPANVYGITLCGHNLPARLVSAFLNREFKETSSEGTKEFVRLVVEVPVREGYPLPPAPARWDAHPSCELQLAARLELSSAGTDEPRNRRQQRELKQEKYANRGS